MRFSKSLTIVTVLLAGGCERAWTTCDASPIGCNSDGLAVRVDVVGNSEYDIDIACGGVRHERLASYRLDFPRDRAGRISDQPQSVRSLDTTQNFEHSSPVTNVWTAGPPYGRIDAGESSDPAWAEAVDHAVAFADSIPRSGDIGAGAAYLFFVLPGECVAILPVAARASDRPTFAFGGRTYHCRDAFIWFSRSFPPGRAADGIDGSTAVVVDKVIGSLTSWLPKAADGSVDEITVNYRTGETTRRVRNLLPFLEVFERIRISERH